MAIKFLNNISLENLELQNAKLHLVESTNPNLTGSTYEGRVIYNKADNAIYFHNGGSVNGSQWVKLDGTGDITGVTVNAGDGLVASGGSESATSGAFSVTLAVNVDDTTIELDGDAIQAKTAAIADGGTGLATADQIHTFVTSFNYIDGNESITLSGDVTGSGTTSITTTIADTAVTHAKYQHIADNTIIGRIGQGSAGDPSEIDTTEFVPFLKTALASGFASNAATIGDSTDHITIGQDLTVNRDLSVSNDASITKELTVSGTANLDGGIDVNGAKFTVSSAGAVHTDSNLNVDGNATIGGDLTVTGTVISTATERIDLEDSVILLNSNASGTPAGTQDAGLEVERGSSTNVSLTWDESAARWTFTNDGSNFYNIPISTEYNNYVHPSHTAISEDEGGITFISAISVDTLGHTTSVSTSIIQSASTGQKGVTRHATNAEAKTATATNRSVTPASNEAHYTNKSFIVDLDSGAESSVALASGTGDYTVTHDLGSYNVLVQVLDISASPATYDTVFCDVTRPSDTTVKISFASAPGEGDYKVLINRLD
ncbi:MAG: hypothetical protein Tp133SUR523431_40 [Prokaryotic dsDNA virus sp.]|mgnify:CR=1 FL=1|nr:MAG: hypothetical protein Tp133SUR523431_40 [Prokaryotic dsDNA virus sp.]|tara:strand:+ start:6424 stop:8064 length:1641 start_codon:yes stop_codon:yes gene_type:complete